MSTVAALILAAGSSERFGSANKLLAAVDGRPMLASVLDSTGTPCVGRTLVITGHEAGSIARLVSTRRLQHPEQTIECEHNPDYRSGMGTSLACGVSHLLDTEAIIVCLGDMPWVRSSVLESLVTCFHKRPQASMVIPVYNGQRGNPVLLAAGLYPDVLELSGDVGARRVAARIPAQVLECPVASDSILRDCDHPGLMTGF